jgi:hypothetical protein
VAEMMPEPVRVHLHPALASPAGDDLVGGFLPSRSVADCRLIGHLTCMIVAGRRLASLGFCLRWLPLQRI